MAATIAMKTISLAIGCHTRCPCRHTRPHSSSRPREHLPRDRCTIRLRCICRAHCRPRPGRLPRPNCTGARLLCADRCTSRGRTQPSRPLRPRTRAERCPSCRPRRRRHCAHCTHCRPRPGRRLRIHCAPARCRPKSGGQPRGRPLPRLAGPCTSRQSPPRTGRAAPRCAPRRRRGHQGTHGPSTRPRPPPAGDGRDRGARRRPRL